ncbi:hypothetical protein BGZ83_003880, partial [Gryganskiella cystojenkinii]
MVNTTSTSSLAETQPTNGIHLDEETRNQEIVASLRGFLKHQTERVALYKEFNDAFKEYIAKRMTQEEYATICRIVTEGFVELSVEILALEAHLAGTNTSDEGADVASTSSSRLSLNSPEHAQLIRAVQMLEKEKLALTVQGQKYVLAQEEQKERDQKDLAAELLTDRVIAADDINENDNNHKSHGQEVDVDMTTVDGSSSSSSAAATTETSSSSSASTQDHVEKLSVEGWQAKLDENRN